jgi:hypothetical protein
MSNVPDRTGRDQETHQPQVRFRFVSLDDYWMGRDRKYQTEWTGAVRENASILLTRVNELLEIAEKQGTGPKYMHESCVASGWRPKAVNDATSNAGARSLHITGEAVDLRDWTDRRFARWCLRNADELRRLALWMEDPRWTPSWVHLQSRPPRSGRLVFVPSTRPPLAPPLPEQGSETTR